MKLTEKEKRLVQSLRLGKSIICNCSFGLGVATVLGDDGRVMICVDEDLTPSPQHFALRKFMRQTAKKWLAHVDRKVQPRHGESG